ncbi:MAG: hypothetical protein KC609_16405, partial [Myxococcales bacterium]|nr:hypothetical protein [Myxococcales bacterium]
EVQIKKLADGRYLADARIPIRDLVEVISVEIPSDGDYETLGGFLMCNAGRVPEMNSKIEWNGLTFTIKDADNKSIHQVEIDKRAHVVAPEP